MPAIHYLAYGSNLHPLRLAARVPSARALGTVKLPGYRLAFHKRSIDGSGKCLIYPNQGRRNCVYGVLYEFEQGEKQLLDQVEGLGQGYSETLLELPCNEVLYTPYTYIAQPGYIDPGLTPYHWYKALVVAGARFHGFPEWYVACLEATPSRPDPNGERTALNAVLLRRIKKANSGLS